MAEVSDAQLAQLGIKLERISIRVNSFGSSLATISNQLAQASALEQMKEKQEQDRQRILAEQALAAGKESIFERKLQSALVKPLQSIGQRTSGVLEVLKRFFLSLGAAWLTGQGFQALQASIDGNKEKLEEIKENVLGGLRKVFVLYRLVKVGITGAIRTILGIAGKVFNAVYTGLIKKPFIAVMNGIRGALRVATNTIRGMFGLAAIPARVPATRVPGAGGNRGGGGGGSIFGRVFTGLSGVFNILNGENVDATLAALSMIPGRGWVFKGIRALAGTVFTLDEILEAFGSNLTGEDAAKLRQQQQSQMPQGFMRGFTGTLDAITGNMFDLDKRGDGVEANTSQANFQSMDESTAADVSPTGSSEGTAAQISSPGNMGTPASSVGPTPAAKPEVNIIPTTVPANQVPNETAPTAASIPRIVSFNKDNFYPLYSQVNYNVVT